ncbi:MAG: hypothetical protein GEU94_16920 [Micromonosporaceae bacterium]|nr:hypothetical protein [Micromonosporaceae bacterium]
MVDGDAAVVEADTEADTGALPTVAAQDDARSPAAPSGDGPHAPVSRVPAPPEERREPDAKFADPEFADPLSDPLPEALQGPAGGGPRDTGPYALPTGTALSLFDRMRLEAEAGSDATPAPGARPPQTAPPGQAQAIGRVSPMVPRQFAGRAELPQADPTGSEPASAESHHRVEPPPDGSPRQAEQQHQPQPPWNHWRERVDPPGADSSPAVSQPSSPAPDDHGDDAEFTATAATYDASDGPGQPDADMVLSAVRELPGVRGAELVGEPGQQQVLRLDLIGSVDPHVVGRQAAALLRDRLGVHAAVRARSQQVSEPSRRFAEPHRLAADGPAGGDAGRRGHRDGSGEARDPLGASHGLPVSVEQVQVVTAGLEAAVEVGLAIGGVRVAGRASGPAHDWHVLRAAVTATIEALGMLLAGRARLALEYAELVSAGPAKVAVVSLLSLSSAGAERVAGAAPVVGEAPDAAVLATIAAVRHQLPDLLGDTAIGS